MPNSSYSDVMNIDAFEEDERLGVDDDGDKPWILPSAIPGIGGGAGGGGDVPGGGDLPPGGVEPEVGDTCESLNMDPMSPDDESVSVAKWAGIYKEGQFPWCVKKGAQPRLPGPEKTPEPVDKLCRDQEYIPKDEANKKMLYAGAAGLAGGLLLGALAGYFVGKP